MDQDHPQPKQDREPPIWLLSAALAVASVAIAVLQMRDQVQLIDSFTIPTAALVVAFMAAEYFVVHLHSRSESITISFIAMPLILGALFQDPYQVWSAMTLGSALAFILIRRQHPTKATFNTTNYSFQAAIALTIMHWLNAGADPLGPQGWLAAGTAAVVSTSATTLVLSAVVSLVEKRVNWRRIRSALGFLAMTSFTSASVALIAATLIDARPAALALLIAPVIVLGFAYRSVVTEREHRERLQHVHESASQIRAIRDLSAIPEVLSGMATRMRAARADLILLPVDGSDQPAMWYSAVDDVTQNAAVSNAWLKLANQLVTETSGPTFVDAKLIPQLATLLDTELDSAIMGVVHGDGVLGLLTVGNRLGQVTRFTDGDLSMFSTIVDQLTLALENNELGHVVTELKRVGRELTEAANHDPLTGLANRTLLSKVLTKALRDHTPVSVLYLDLDDFKLINDGLGHDAGDQVLVQTARRLTTAAGPDACVSRIGGDEFVVVLFDTADDLLVANHLLEVINGLMAIADHEVQVGASIGLSRARPGQDPASLISNADTAMYTAKGTGKGSVVLDKPTAPTRIRTVVS